MASEQISRQWRGNWAAGMVLGACVSAMAQGSSNCDAAGYRVVGARWDTVLQRNWEVRQDCLHPDWPARLAGFATRLGVGKKQEVRTETGGLQAAEVEGNNAPLLVRAGEAVRLWAREERVRIEMSGVVEQSAHLGERVVVRITRQSDDTGLTVERVGGVVRGVGDVEMER